MKHLVLLLVMVTAAMAFEQPPYRNWKLAVVETEGMIDLSYHRSQEECEAKKALYYKGMDNYKCVMIK
jgi:hypothetical protein